MVPNHYFTVIGFISPITTYFLALLKPNRAIACLRQGRLQRGPLCRGELFGWQLRHSMTRPFFLSSSFLHFSSARVFQFCFLTRVRPPCGSLRGRLEHDNQSMMCYAWRLPLALKVFRNDSISKCCVLLK